MNLISKASMPKFLRNYVTRSNCYGLKLIARTLSTQPKQTDEHDEINNEPVSFFGSNAASWKAKNTRSGYSDEYPSYQPYVISGSLAIFLIYFCILREENDIDQKLSKNLFEQVPELEEISLTVNYRYNREHNIDNTEVEKQLKALGVDISKL